MNHPQRQGTAHTPTRPQVKICGLTRPDEAAACADMGADAIGLVFFPKSPRHVTPATAKTVVDVLPQSVATVGVFVNASFTFIMDRVAHCGLSMVQLHGQELPQLSARLKAEAIGVIKALFVDGVPGMADAKNYQVDAFLAECTKGPLPGGNAMAWDWGAASDFARQSPLVLAGGLSPGNVHDAIQACQPWAVDVSSGVEASPGRKDIHKVQRLLAAVRKTEDQYAGLMVKPVFVPRGRTSNA